MAGLKAWAKTKVKYLLTYHVWGNLLTKNCRLNPNTSLRRRLTESHSLPMHPRIVAPIVSMVSDPSGASAISIVESVALYSSSMKWILLNWQQLLPDQNLQLILKVCSSPGRLLQIASLKEPATPSVLIKRTATARNYPPILSQNSINWDLPWICGLLVFQKSLSHKKFINQSSVSFSCICLFSLFKLYCHSLFASMKFSSIHSPFALLSS